jgi:predicted dehydrogenase
MLSIGIHAIDLLLWIVGRRVVGAAGREWLGRPHVDVATGGELVVLFEGGARAELRVTVDAAGGDNGVRLEVSGGSASAELIAGEGDPTASALVLHGVGPTAHDDVGGATGSPLLVPFIMEAIADHELGRSSVSVEDVAQAHALAFGVEAAGRAA